MPEQLVELARASCQEIALTCVPPGNGVRIGIGDEPVELAVVARLGTPLPQLAAELGAIVHRVCGPVAIEVIFSDVEVGAGSAAEAAAR